MPSGIEGEVGGGATADLRAKEDPSEMTVERAAGGTGKTAAGGGAAVRTAAAGIGERVGVITMTAGR